jgi:hypothetical protein
MLGEFYEKFTAWMAAAREPDADTTVLQRILGALAKVQEWAPEVKRGRRTYSDERFVASVREQMEKGDRQVSQRQMETLLKIACHYRQQVPEMESVVREVGFEEMLEDRSLQPPRESTIRKLELLRGVGLAEAAKNFVDSLAARVHAQRSLSDAQLKALNNVVLLHAGEIENFEQIREELDVGVSEVGSDTESKGLLEAMGQIKEWHAPVVRGKRVFNDEAFYKSLADHFGRKGFLSPRQRFALKKLVVRYRVQIAGYDELAESHGLRKSGE